ncbi:acetyltransferase (GNAT) family protein [Sinobacterium caligoides]|uniref:Acetyltransferase (GNAT) family protein n=1 Tax=Sinobacterium caligoides TaxID=933926 RepID=A0A3N2DK06_9GAMM|nr:GNAT family N-acetyltransferase [Sinobacterium caligoides]ROS00116.1 acetyltransferase (GNAT) family protein [Sinobacterium caligoides]
MVEVSVFKEGDETLWDAFVTCANNGTLFHTMKFLRYHPPTRFDNHHLMFHRADSLVAVLPGAIVGGQSYQSPCGASYGGLVLDKGLGLEDCIAIIEALVEYCTELGLKDIELTGVPRDYWCSYDDHLDYGLLYHGFQCQSTVLNYVIDLRLDAVEETFSKNIRRDIRQNIRRGVSVQRGELDELDVFYQMLRDNKAKNHAVATHSEEELRHLVRHFPATIEIYFARLEQECIGAIVLFHCNDNAALTFYICHREAFSSFCPATLLIAHLTELCKARGCRALDLGPSTWPDMTLHEGLIHYKQRFSARGMRRDSWKLSL